MKTIKVPLKMFALVACLSFTMSVGAYIFEYGNIYYNITSGNTVEVTCSNYTKKPYNKVGSIYTGKIAIPPTVHNNGRVYTVTAIGDHAFDFTAANGNKDYHDTGLIYVSIPNTVTRIGQYAFAQCYGIENMTIPSSVTYIDNNAFSQCPQMESLTCLTNTPPTLGGSNVFGKYMPGIHVPKGCIDNYFSAKYWKDAPSFWEVTFGFEHNGIYYNTTGTNTVEVTCGQEFGGDGWGCYNIDCYFGDIVIPSNVSHGGQTYTVTAIGDYAFDYSWSSGDDYDSGCGKDLTGVTIPPTVTRIGARSFKCCNDLMNVICMASTPPAMTASGAFESKAYETGTLFVPKGCVAAYRSANGWKNFLYVEELTYDFCVDGIYYNIISSNTVEVTHGQEYGGEGVWYYNCGYVLDNIALSPTVTYEGKTYTVSAIGDNAFDYSFNDECTSGDIMDLSSVTIPKTVTRIGPDAFKCCSALRSVICLAKDPPRGTGTGFDSEVYESATLYVPRGCSKAYKSANGWKNFVFIEELSYDFSYDGIYYNITGDNTVEVTYGQRFGSEGIWYYNEDCYFGDITIPATVTNEGQIYKVTAIGDHAFDYSISDEECFEGGQYFTSVIIPNTVSRIGKNAFKCCSGLKKVTCLAKTPPSGAWFESLVYSSATLTVLSNYTDAYQKADGWKQFSKIKGVKFTDLPVAPGHIRYPRSPRSPSRVGRNIKSSN